MAVDIIGTYAPKEATYLVQTASGSLTNEQALSSLATGLMSVTNGTGVVSSITTSAGLAGLLSDETGTGALVFANTPTFITPVLGTPTSGTLSNCSGLPIAGVTGDAVTALAAGSIELGHATDTTLTRVSAGVMAVEGKNVALNGTGEALTTGTIELGHASDTTLARVSAGVASIEGKNIALNGTGEALTTGTIELGHASDTTLARVSSGVMSIEGVTVPTISSTNTFTNKRVTPRVGSTASSATPTINTDDYDAYSITALATAITSFTTNLSGTPTNFQKLIIRIKDDGTARAIAWGASFEAKGVDLPTTTVISKVLTVGFLYDTVTSKWGCVASVQEA